MPGQPDHSGQSGEPDRSDQPDQSGQSDWSDRPDQSGQPDRPDQSGQPDQPDQSGQPDWSDQPDQSDPTDGLSASIDAPVEEIETLFDDWAEQYDDDVASWGYRAPAMVAATLIQGGAPTGEVLDAGCGTGLSGAALHAVGVGRIVGIDLSPLSLESAQRRGGYTELVRADLNEPLPFDDDRFAAAVSVGVLGYPEDPASVVNELIRVVRPGGRIVFTQRTDVWASAHFDGLIGRLESAGSCRADVSEPLDYLPGNPEYGADIRMVITALDLLT